MSDASSSCDRCKHLVKLGEDMVELLEEARNMAITEGIDRMVEDINMAIESWDSVVLRFG